MLILNLLLFGRHRRRYLGGQMAWIPVWAPASSTASRHYWGYRNFEAPDASTNLAALDADHWRRAATTTTTPTPTSAKFSVKPYEFDIGWMYIRIPVRAGLGQGSQTPPKLALGEIKPLARQDAGGLHRQPLRGDGLCA